MEISFRVFYIIVVFSKKHFNSYMHKLMQTNQLHKHLWVTINRSLENKTQQQSNAKTQMQPNFPIKHFYMSYCFQNNQPSFHPNCNNNNLSKELLNPINVLCFFARVQILLILRKIYYFHLISIFYTYYD